MKRCKSNGLCCGAGGAQMFKDAEKGEKEIFVERTEEAIETKPDFGRALQLYKNKEFDEASAIFKRVYLKNPDDRGAELYITLLEFGIPEEWDGVETLRDKY
jgi:TolA-binding protein